MRDTPLGLGPSQHGSPAGDGVSASPEHRRPSPVSPAAAPGLSRASSLTAQKAHGAPAPGLSDSRVSVVNQSCGFWPWLAFRAAQLLSRREWPHGHQPTEVPRALRSQKPHRRGSWSLRHGPRLDPGRGEPTLLRLRRRTGLGHCHVAPRPIVTRVIPLLSGTTSARRPQR